MKKLNRKGFTLIELLAIIVILAIITVVTIPTVLSSMSTARQDMLTNSANSIAEWVEKQYGNTLLGTPDTTFSNVCTTGSAGNGYCVNSAYTQGTEDGLSALSNAAALAFINAAGGKGTNYSYIYVKITNGRACVKLTAAEDGAFDTLKGNTVSSSACPEE